MYARLVHVVVHIVVYMQGPPWSIEKFVKKQRLIEGQIGKTGSG